MSATAHGKAAKSDEDTTELLRRMELDASYSSASRLGFDELIDPRETRDRLLDALDLALNRRQEPAAPVTRSAITP
jgi:acetyl-CoA carboxylase carboxyltransferase component